MSPPTALARRVARMAAQKLNALGVVHVDYSKSKWIKMRDSAVKRLDSEARFYAWRNQIIKRAKLKNYTFNEYVAVLDTPARNVPDTYSLGGFGYVCATFRAGNYISWSSIDWISELPGEENNLYRSAMTVAHEIAHNLGARHVERNRDVMNTFALAQPLDTRFSWSEITKQQIKECIERK